METWAEDWTPHNRARLPISQQQMDCSPPASSNATSTSTPGGGGGGSPTPRSRKPGAVIESFVNHAPGVFSGTFSGRYHPPHTGDLEVSRTGCAQ